LSSGSDLDAAFETLIQLRAGALTITADGLFADNRDQIAALGLRHALPTVVGSHESVVAGGLMPSNQLTESVLVVIDKNSRDKVRISQLHSRRLR
jgi:hypothetical protein